jgi:multiple sugar transport system ATP-binding protein
MSSLTISKLCKSFGPVEVLKGVDLEARTGEFVALVGPSGCGKSTLLAMIAGLETISSGEIRIDGRLINSVAPKDRDIAMVFQSYALYPTMTVRQNITFGMESRRVPRNVQDEAVKRVAALLQIEPLLLRKPGQLSGGQRQRVAMGRALVRDPKLFLFDEPLSNLDAKLRVEMRSEIKRLHQRVGKTTIYVTHDQVEAMTLASRIAVMHKGELQQFDVPRMVYDRPANMFVASFMGSPSMNFLSAEIADEQGGTLRLANGESGPLTLGLAAPVSCEGMGCNVILGVRPEHISLHRPDRAADKRACAIVPATVEIVEPTGAETMVGLRLAGREVTARFEPHEAPDVGQTVTLSLDMSKACLFDAKTEQLIA